MSVETVMVGPAPRLAVSVAGDGPFVLFLHGIRGNRRNWELQLAAFSKRFRAADRGGADGPGTFPCCEISRCNGFPLFRSPPPQKRAAQASQTTTSLRASQSDLSMHSLQRSANSAASTLRV